MAEDKKNGKSKAGSAKSGAKDARSRTIELTAEDVTPPEPAKAAKAGRPASGADKPEAPDKTKDAAQDAPPASGSKAGGVMAYALSGLFGGVAALLGAAVLISFQMIDLSGNAGQRATDSIGALDKQVNAALAEARGRGTGRDDALAALKTGVDKTVSRASVHEDMIGKTSAAVNEMEKGLKQALSQVAGLSGRLNRLTASLGAVEKRLESLNGHMGGLGAKLGAEAESRKALGPRIVANAGMLEKRGTDIARLMKWQDAMSAETRKLGRQMTSLLGGLKDIERSVADASAAGGGEPSSAGVRLALLDRKIQRLGKDMAGLNATLQSLPAVPPDLSPQISVLEKTVARFDKGFAEAGRRHAGVQNNVRLLDERVRDLALMGGRMDAVNSRIDEVKSRYAELGSSMRVLQSAARALGLGEDGSSAALKALEGKLSALRGDISGRIAALEKTTAGIGEAEAKLAGVDVRLESVKTAQTKLAAMQQKAAREQAAARLSRDLLSGQAYSEALAGFASLVPKAIIPDSVRALAPKGVPSRDALASSFAALRQAIDAAEVLKSDDGLMGRLMKSAGSVVSIRRTGPVSGSSPSAIASRIADYLVRGELALVLSEASGITGPAGDKASAWAAQVKARLQAEKFAADVMALAMAGSEQG